MNQAYSPFGGRDLVPDEETALQIGTAILRARYGQEYFRRFEPYSADLSEGKWSVCGDSPAHKEARQEMERLGPDNLIVVYGGGGPCVTFSARDAQVEMIHLMR